MSMRKRLAKAIRNFGQDGDDENALADYLISKGWRDTEKRTKIQQVTVVPSPVLGIGMKTTKPSKHNKNTGW